MLLPRRRDDCVSVRGGRKTPRIVATGKVPPDEAWALLDIAFDSGARRVTAYCFADNTASARMMEKLGMHRQAHFRADSLHRSGQWLDSFVYAILDTDPR